MPPRWSKQGCMKHLCPKLTCDRTRDDIGNTHGACGSPSATGLCRRGYKACCKVFGIWRLGGFLTASCKAQHSKSETQQTQQSTTTWLLHSNPCTRYTWAATRHTRTRTRTLKHAHKHIYTHTHICTGALTGMRARTRTHAHTHTHLHTRRCTHTHMHTHARTHRRCTHIVACLNCAVGAEVKGSEPC